jgi:NCAIR mutase (PurE)-related protein
VDQADVTGILEAVKDGSLTVDAAVERLKVLPVVRSGDVVHDAHRALRRGLAEVVFAEGKSDAHLLDAVKAAVESGENCLVTRVTAGQAAIVTQAMTGRDVSYHKAARLLTIVQKPIADLGRGEILVISAGTSDVPVAEEAAVTCATLGNRVRRVYDVGVAGLHRLLQHVDAIRDATAIIVVAGMEGALPSVVAGLAPCPVIGVPTSVGYGTAFGGVTPLLAMLNSCAGGVTVVNIDNGFGAAVSATLINRRRD